MGLKGRQRRLRHFDQRAEAFQHGLMKKSSVSKLVQRDKPLKVGVGKHKRLVEKKFIHLAAAKRLESRLQAYLKGNKITPEHYSLVEVGTSLEFAVQEYFNKPSVVELEKFLETSKFQVEANKITGNFSREQALLCKRFVNQHKGITLEKLLAASDELRSHIRKALQMNLAIVPENILVIGRTNNGKIRLALVDL